MPAMDFLKKLRLGSIFGNMGQPDPTFGGAYNPQYQTPPFVDNPAPQGPQPGALGDIAARMNQIYQPEHQNIDQFNTMLSQYPQFKEPGKLRKFGAAALGALTDLGGNPRVKGTDVFDEFTGKRQFNEDVANWKTKIGPVEQAANIERQSNANNRQFAYQAASAQLRQDAQDAKEQNDHVRAGIAQQRADAYEFKIKNPNVTFDFSTPFVMIKDPVTQTVRKAVDSQGKPILTGNMSDEDQIALKQKGAMAQIDRKGELASDLEGQRQTGRETLQSMRGWDVVNIPDPNDPSRQIAVRINRDTGDVQPVTLGGKQTGAVTSASQSGANREPLPTQQRVDFFNRAQELFNTRPDLRPFIELGIPGSNDFNIAKPNDPKTILGVKMGKQGPTPEQLQEIQNYIYGSNRTAAPAGGTRTNVPPPPPNTGGRGGGPPPAGMQQANMANRNAAIAELQNQNPPKPITDNNIQFVLNEWRRMGRIK